VPVVLERLFLPLLATLLVGLIILNPFKFDWQQQVSLSIAVVAIVYFVDHTIRRFDTHQGNEDQSRNRHAPRRPNQVSNNNLPKAPLESIVSINPSDGMKARQMQIDGAPVMERVLSPEQITIIADCLSRYPARAVSFKYRDGDEEAHRLCNQLVSAFVQGRWSARMDGSFTRSGISHGVRIMPGSNLADVEPIYAALKNAKLDDLDVPPDPTPGGVEIIVASIRNQLRF
jgi:hypothetical protein